MHPQKIETAILLLISSDLKILTLTRIFTLSNRITRKFLSVTRALTRTFTRINIRNQYKTRTSTQNLTGSRT